MGDFCCKKDVFVIKGDLLEVYFEMGGIPPESVKTVYFISDVAGISTCCPYSKVQEGYCLRLDSEVTNTLDPCIGSYDVIVEFVDGNLLTVIREGLFAVLKTRNSGVEEIHE